MWKRASLCLLAVALGAISATANASTTIFGPKTYVLATGAPQTFDDSFTVDLSDTCDGKAVYFISVATGDGSHAAASGSVTLNGVTIVGDNDLSNAPQTFEQQVTLGANNALRVLLKGGKQGSVMTISVRREIEESAFGPQSDALTASSGSFSATFDVSDTASPYFLLLQNGAEDGTHFASAATIAVNGVTLASRNDLKDHPVLHVAFAPRSGTNTLRVDLRGAAGDTVRVSIKRRVDESVCTVIGVAIASPPNGSIVNDRRIVVRGTANGSRQIGVSVNGTAAQFDSTHAGTPTDPFLWVATIKAAPGPLAITATATAPNGRTKSASVSVTYAPANDPTSLTAFPPSGVAPFDVHYLLNVPPSNKVARYDLDLDGDGVYESSSPAFPSALSGHFAAAGIYEPAVRMTDTAGHVTRASTVVVVETFAVVDATIHARWKGFIDALGRSDIEGALAFMADETTRIKYRSAFKSLNAFLPQVAADLAQIRTVYIRGDVAHYLVALPVNGQVYGGHVYFERGADGLWRIAMF